jgi:hypothetical protein
VFQLSGDKKHQFHVLKNSAHFRVQMFAANKDKGMFSIFDVMPIFPTRNKTLGRFNVEKIGKLENNMR